MHFTANAKVWHPELGYVKYVRPLKFEEGMCFVEAKRCGMKKVKLMDCFTEKPQKPKLTKEERFHKRFKEQLSVIKDSPTAYFVAGWMAGHDTAFNVSYPPAQAEIVTEVLMQYGVEVEDAAVTQATDLSDNWSCGVYTDAFPLSEQFTSETGITVTHFFNNEDKHSIRAREFILGFLGGELGFLLNHGSRKRTTEELNKIRSRIPADYLNSFESGFRGDYGKQ